MKYQQKGFVTKPPAVYIEDTPSGSRVCYLRKDIIKNSDAWNCITLQFDAPDSLTVESATTHFDELWDQYDPGDTDTTLTDMYEQMVAMQEAQAATDAALCELYESMAGGE